MHILDYPLLCHMLNVADNIPEYLIEVSGEADEEEIGLFA